MLLTSPLLSYEDAAAPVRDEQTGKRGPSDCLRVMPLGRWAWDADPGGVMAGWDREAALCSRATRGESDQS